MDLRSLVTWNENLPEFILTGLWYIEFLNEDLNNSVISTKFFKSLDVYVKDVEIPLVKYSLKKTDFELVDFEEKENFGEVSITFRDDINGSVLRFCQKWLNSIFDVNQNAVKKNWRYERKDIHVVQLKILKKSQGLLLDTIRSSLSSIVGNALAIGGALGLTNYASLNNVEVKSVAEYIIKGCLPLGIEGISLGEGDSGEPQEFILTLSCDKVEPLWGTDSNINITKN